MATYISSKGEQTEIVPTHPPFFSDSELATLVEGTPAFLTLADGSTLIYNDIFYEIGVEKNDVATTLAQNVLPEQTWLAGPVVLLPMKPTSKRSDSKVESAGQTLYLYLVRFEVCDETTGRYLYDNTFLPYVRDEAELHAKIAEIAATRARGQKFLGAEKRVHGMTLMHEHMPASITIQEGIVHGTQE